MILILIKIIFTMKPKQNEPELWSRPTSYQHFRMNVHMLASYFANQLHEPHENTTSWLELINEH